MIALVLAISAIPGTASLRAADTFFEQQAGILIEYYELESLTASALLRAHQAAPDALEMLKETRRLQETGKARLYDSSYVVGRPNGATHLASVRELMFPAEYTPASLPETINGPIAPEAKIQAGATPSRYTTRNLGNSIQVKIHKQADRYQLELDGNLDELAGKRVNSLPIMPSEALVTDSPRSRQSR